MDGVQRKLQTHFIVYIKLSYASAEILSLLDSYLQNSSRSFHKKCDSLN